MHISTSRTTLASLAAFLLFGSTWAAAQVAPAPVPPPGPGEIVPAVPPGFAQPAMQGNFENLLIQLLIDNNRGEITLSQFGRKQSQNQQVQQFADRMIQEHSRFIQQLTALQRGANQPQPGVRSSTDQSSGAISQGQYGQSTGSSADQSQDGTAGVATRQAGPMQAAVTDSRLFAILRQANQRKIALLQQNLSSLQGPQFDQAFIDAEIGAHIGMLAMLETVQNQVSPQARQVLQAGIKTTQDHLAHAKQIHRQVNAEVARQSTGETRR